MDYAFKNYNYFLHRLDDLAHQNCRCLARLARLAHFRRLARRLARYLGVVDPCVRNDRLNSQDTPDLRCRFRLYNAILLAVGRRSVTLQGQINIWQYLVHHCHDILKHLRHDLVIYLLYLNPYLKRHLKPFNHCVTYHFYFLQFFDYLNPFIVIVIQHNIYVLPLIVVAINHVLLILILQFHQL